MAAAKYTEQAYAKLEEGKAYAARAASDAYIKGREVMTKIGIPPEDLAKLAWVPLGVAVAGLFINCIMLLAWFDVGWLSGYALVDGEPIMAFASLSDVQFGLKGEYTTSVPECAAASGVCSFAALSGDCSAVSDSPGSLFGITKLAKNTLKSDWCTLARAGSAANGLLWMGFIPGLFATLMTFLYAAKEIPKAAYLFVKLDSYGVTEYVQKIILAASWVAFWLFILISMMVYAANLPDTIGIGAVKFESSFGLLRLTFLMVSFCTSLIITSLFNIWAADNVVEAWIEFQEAKLLSAKKALYLLLMLQMVFYLLLSIKEISWEFLLVFICGYYLDAKVRNFMILYLVLVVISILLDGIKIGFMSSFDSMSPGDLFGSIVFLLIFMLKFGIMGTIYLYEREDDSQGNAWKPYHGDQEDDMMNEIAE